MVQARSIRQLGRSLWMRSALVSLCVFLGVLGLRRAGALEALELVMYDWYLRLQPAVPADARLVLITISESDIQQQGTWPLADATFAQALTVLEQSQPRAIGLDIYRDLRVEPGHELLLETLRTYANIIAVTKFGVTADTRVPPPPLLQGTARVGFNDVLVDPGGIVRRGLLFVDDGTTQFPSFALRLALLYLKPEHLRLRPDEDHPEHLRVGRMTIRPFAANDGGYVRADERGYQWLLDFQGGHNPFAAYSLSTLLAGEVPAAAIRDKVVLIGTTAISVKDGFYTPYSLTRQSEQQMVGITLHAHSVSQLLRGALEGQAPLAAVREVLGALWLLGWCLLGAGLGLWTRSFPRFVVFYLAGILLLSLMGYAALWQRWWLPVVPAMLGWMLSGLIVITDVSYYEKRQRSRLRRLLALHLSDEVAATLEHDLDQLLSDGRLRPLPLTATVLFSDLEGSTSVAEKLEPHALMDWLNTYMDVMSRQVIMHAGVINKYMGDGLMVLFGVPLPRTSIDAVQQDAFHAVQCALAMEQALRLLNKQWQAQQRPTVRMRIGICTGEVVAGTVGSARRLEYTVLGDTVNTAARLESWGKEAFGHDPGGSPCRILVSASTWQWLGGQFEAEYVGDVPLKGKTQTTAVYHILGQSRAQSTDVVREDNG